MWDFDLPKDSILIIWNYKEEKDFNIFSVFESMQDQIDEMKGYK